MTIIPENIPGHTLHVVCMRDQYPYYHFAPLRAWCSDPQFNVLIGIYPSHPAAKAVADELNLLSSWDGSDKARFGSDGLWAGNGSFSAGGE